MKVYKLTLYEGHTVIRVDHYTTMEAAKAQKEVIISTLAEILGTHVHKYEVEVRQIEVRES